MKVMTMKKLLAFTALFAVATAFAGKIAVVDMDVILEKHPNTPNDKKVLETTLADYSKERDALRDALEVKQSDLEKQVKEAQNPMLAPAKAAEMRKACEVAFRELERERLNAEKQMAERTRQLNEMENRFIKRTADEIHAHIEAYAKEKGYDAVLYKNVVPYVKPEFEITNQIIVLCGGMPDRKPTVKTAEELAAPAPAVYEDSAE